MLSVVVSLLKRQQDLCFLPHFCSLWDYPQLKNKGPGPLCLKLVGVLSKITCDFIYGHKAELV